GIAPALVNCGQLSTGPLLSEGAMLAAEQLPAAFLKLISSESKQTEVEVNRWIVRFNLCRTAQLRFRVRVGSRGEQQFSQAQPGSKIVRVHPVAQFGRFAQKGLCRR